MTPETVQLDPWVLPLLAGTITPILTGIVTRPRATSGTKALVGLLAAALAAAGIEVIHWLTTAGGTFEFRPALVLFLVTFATHLAAYYGFWKPVGGGAAPGATTTRGFIG